MIMADTQDDFSQENNAENIKPSIKKNKPTDLPDNEHDEQRMQVEEVIIDLPDVSDIPGQETIHVPPLGMLADTTISSDDEEGVGLFGDDDEDEDTEMIMGTNADVSDQEQDVLDDLEGGMPSEDDQQLSAAKLDDEDFEGVALNEGSLATDVSGDDLDTNAESYGEDNIGLQVDEENSNTSLDKN